MQLTSWCQKAGMYRTSPSCRVTRYGRHRFNLGRRGKGAWRGQAIRTSVPALTPSMSPKSTHEWFRLSAPGGSCFGLRLSPHPKRLQA